MKRPLFQDWWTYVFLVIAILNLANGFWMLAAPERWYHDLPAAVPDTGPLNAHFVRDIGAAFITLGAVLLWGAFRLAERITMLAIVVLFYVLHAGIHVYDSSQGLVPPDHWYADIPAVYVPTVALIALLVALVRQETGPSR